MTRREIIFGAGSLLWADGVYPPGLTVEAYIFQQYAKRKGKTLQDVLPEVIPMARETGFHNVELNAEFLTPELSRQTLELVRSNGLRMPSVYSGGPLHDERAEGTIAKALTTGRSCQPFGCQAVVCNADPKGEGIRKTDRELERQASVMNRMGRELAASGLQLRVHNHTPEMLDNAREWRSTLRGTDPQYVTLCLDLDWVRQGDQDALGLLKEAGKRVSEIHVRNSRDKLWLEAFEPGDIDYTAIAGYLKSAGLKPLIAVELAYREKTAVTRPLADDLRASRLYAEQVFGTR